MTTTKLVLVLLFSASCGQESATPALRTNSQTDEPAAGKAAAARSGWSSPVSPPSGCGGALALNASGAMVFGNYSQTGSGLEAFSIEVCTSEDGASWTGPTTIGLGVAPAVALAANGRAVAIWQGGPATSPNVQASQRAPGGSWSEPVVISTVPGHPVIAMDGAGNAVAIWSGTTTGEPVAMSRLAANGNWTPAQTLVSRGGGPNLAVSANGSLIATWRSGNEIEVATGTALGGLSAAQPMGLTYGGIHAAKVAINDAGQAIIGWQNQTNMVATRNNGTWSSATSLGNSTPAGIAVAIDAAGTALVAFSEDVYTLSELSGVPTYAAFHGNGGSWPAPTLLSALTDKGDVNAGCDAAGTFIITWANEAGSVEALTLQQAQTFGPGVVVGTGLASQLQITGGEAVLGIASGIAKETI